jgi:hypothetical protein
MIEQLHRNAEKLTDKIRTNPHPIAKCRRYEAAELVAIKDAIRALRVIGEYHSKFSAAYCEHIQKEREG